MRTLSLLPTTLVSILVMAASLLLITGPAMGQMRTQPANPSPQFGRGGATLIGEIKGTIFASVAKADDPKGLIIRSEPSTSAQTVAYLALGTMLKGPSAYRAGWIKVDAGQYQGWVSLANLKAIGEEATVTSVDRPENCLRIRMGPSIAHQVIGCAGMGEKLRLSGFWSYNYWAGLDGQGWIHGSQIASEPRPPRPASTASRVTGRHPSGSARSDPESYRGDLDVWGYPLYGYYSPYWYWSRHRRHFYHTGEHSDHRFKAYSSSGSGSRR
jgi:hypothetical protein